MALIQLTGKYAVGPYRYATVDEDMVPFLSQWKWKAKPNGGGNNVYAVRNATRQGKYITLRMHRVVSGLPQDDPRDIDHVNHNSLDNRRSNLAVASRSENILNARRMVVTGVCQHCGVSISREVSATVRGAALSCDACKTLRRRRPARSAIRFMRCAECDVLVAGRTSLRRYCSEACRCRARYRKRGSSARV